MIYPPFLFPNLLLGLVSALVAGWVALRLALRWGLIDVPGVLPHKQHARPTPLAGGLTLAAVLLVGMVANRQMAAALWQVWPALGVIFCFALWDDRWRLSPRVKLIGQLGAAVLLLALGLSVRVIKPGFLGMDAVLALWLNRAITLLWLVGVTNAFNLLDSMDGLVVGVSGIAVAFMLLVTLSAGDEMLLRLLALLQGALFGLYYYNAMPARFFLGDAGAQTLGFLLAVVAVLFTPPGRPQASAWFLPVLILAVPLFDTSLVIFSRLRRQRPIFRAGRDHTYHRLVRMGVEPHRAVTVLHLGAVGVGALAFLAFQLPPLPANALFVALSLIAICLFFWLEAYKGD